MTTPHEFTPTPEQVEEVAIRMLEQSFAALTWAMIHSESKHDLRQYAKWHLTELHRETETLRSQLDALKAQVVVGKSSPENWGKHFHWCRVFSSDVTYSNAKQSCSCGYEQALTQLSPK